MKSLAAYSIYHMLMKYVGNCHYPSGDCWAWSEQSKLASLGIILQFGKCGSTQTVKPVFE